MRLSLKLARLILSKAGLLLNESRFRVVGRNRFTDSVNLSCFALAARMKFYNRVMSFAFPRGGGKRVAPRNESFFESPNRDSTAVNELKSRDYLRS